MMRKNDKKWISINNDSGEEAVVQISAIESILNTYDGDTPEIAINMVSGTTYSIKYSSEQERNTHFKLLLEAIVTGMPIM